MKNTPISILVCICLVIAAFLGGMYVGRNAIGTGIQVSLVPTLGQSPNDSTSPSQVTSPTGSSGTESSVPVSVPADTGKININTADLQTLMTLDGIGEVYAQRIIEYRNAHGPFQNITEITKVSGIGEKRFKAIMDHITVGG